MSSLMRRLALTVLFAAAALLLLPAEPARAQGGCGQGMNRSPRSGMTRQLTLMPQPNALSQQYAMQQYALSQQYAVQQSALTALLRQQQFAMMVAQPQAPLNAMMVAQLQRQAQNALPVAQPQQQPQPNPPAAQVRLQAAPVDDPPAVKPLKPEDAAARKLDAVRDLLADARTAQQNGEAQRATQMRARASERLRNLVAAYPGTWAANKAQDLLDELTP
jgi:hypothetical protein